jgi:metal-responsive CopG/Arc/MetJ family transcriptional regulator
MVRGLKTDIISVRFDPHTFEEMDQVLKGGEIRAVFIRTAIDNEIRRRKNERVPVSRRIPKAN